MLTESRSAVADLGRAGKDGRKKLKRHEET